MTYSVYVHVPFCLRRCGYCDFNTYTARDLGAGITQESYADFVISEMDIVKAWQDERGFNEPKVSTVFFGGGTPTILPADDVVRILDHIAQLWGIEENAEITAEANPDTVDKAYLTTLAQGGINRISCGMQSIVPHVLQTLDRTHTPTNVVDNITIAQELGLRTSVDLIYGTPGESVDDWKQSVQAALDLSVQHVSAYALTIEPHTKMGRQVAQGVLPQPDEDDQALKYEIADDMFAQAGLQWYEVSNWCMAGQESEHNLGYWRNVDWAGIGPGAHSHYNAPLGKDDTPALRSWDISHPRRWGMQVNAGQVPWEDSENIDLTMNIEELAILGLRMREGLDIEQFETAAGMRIPEVTQDELVRDGLVTIASGRMVATRRGRLLNDFIISTVISSVGL